jgi:pSer/pThr/pTyr-binding forkhead associated (FHA) protein
MKSNIKDFPMLVGQDGSQDGQRWILRKVLILGRGEDCDVIIPNQQVSRQHAILKLTPQGVILEDLGSKNGTHCNGEQVIEPRIMKEEDVIQIALAQKFILVSSDATIPLTEKDKILDTLSLEEVIPRLRIDERSRRVWVRGNEVIPSLSLLQFNLLNALYQQEGRVASRSEVITSVWGEDGAIGVTEQALDALVRRLRDRLAEFDSKHEYIITIRGHGIRLEI